MATESALAPTPVAVPPMVAEAVLAQPPVTVLPVAADAAVNVLAPPPVAADDDAGAVVALTLPPVAVPPMAADDADDALVPSPFADAPVTADDADVDFVTRTLAAPPPEEKSAYVTDAEEKVPSQAEINKVHEYIDALLPTLQKSCGMVTDMKENETNHFSLALPSYNDTESNQGAVRKKLEETDDALDHSVSGNQQPIADSKEDVQKEKSRSQQPVPCPSDQQQNPTLGCERNDESQDVSRAKSDEELTPSEMRYMMQRRLMNPRRMMRNQYGDTCFMDPRFRRNMDNGYDQCCYSDESDRTHDCDAWRFDHRFDYHDAHHQMRHARCRRIECPCHWKDGNCHRNSGHPCCPGSDPYYPMDVDDLSDHFLSNEIDHIDDADDDASLYVTFHQRDHHRIFRERSGCPCHCNHRRNHRNYGYRCQNGLKPYSPMAMARERWSPSKPDGEHMGRWSTPKLDLEKEKYNVGAALFNPQKWTCFLNCILQCMVHTVPLVLKLQEADHPDPCPRASIGFCCYCSLKMHTNESIKRSGSAFYPMRFVDCLNAISPDFGWGVQQDAQELLRCLLDKLDEASVVPRSLEEPPSTEGGIAKEVFGGRLKSQLHCPECNHCSDRSEPFLDLSLEVNMVETLIDALESFTKIEVIQDVMCDGCKSRVNMEKHLKIEQAPEVLVIHLKRFLHSGNDISKILDRVKYTLVMDIDPFMCCVDDVPQKYDLYGVVEHWGNYGRSHYVCFIRSSQTDWYKFDDDSVYKYSEEEVVDRTSYLLFYVKQGKSPWFSSLLEKKSSQDGPAEQGPDGLHKDKEESTSSDGQSGSDTLLDEPEQLEEGCSLGEISEESQEPSCVTVSGGKNGHVDSLTEPLEMKEDGSPRGSLLDRKEMKERTKGDIWGTQGCSSGRNDSTFSLLGRTSPEPSTNSSLHEDQKVACFGAPSEFWTCSSEKKVTAVFRLRQRGRAKIR